MSIPLLQTKLYVPPPRPHLVARSSVTAKLAAGSLLPLTLIAAPAGFGKTTAVSEWIAQATAAVAWLALDEDDNDPTRFLTYLIAALQTRHPSLGGSAQALLDTPQAPPAKAILTLLLNDLSALTAPLILVLDDYHLLTTPAIHEALAFLIDHLPPQVHLIITTRIDPPLPLARWRARNQLTEIRADDLRFRPDEATFEQAARLIEQMGLMVFAQSALHYLLTKWLTSLPAAVVHSRPKLGLTQAWLLLNRMDPEAALPWLDKAEQALLRADRPGDEQDDSDNLRGEIIATRAILITLSRRFEPEQVKGWAQAALACLRPDNASYRGLVWGALGTAAMQQGNIAEAEQAFGKTATISRTAGHEYIALATTLHLTNMQRARGSLTLAITTCQQALAWAAEQQAQNSFGAGNILIQLADLLRERNNLGEALHHVQAGIALSHQGAHPSLFMIGSLVLVRIKQALGDREGLFAITQQIRQMAASLYHADWIMTLLPALEAHLHLLQGDFTAAFQWAHTTDWAEPWPSHFRGTHHFVYACEYGGITRAQPLLTQAWAHASPGLPMGLAPTPPIDQERLLDVSAYLQRQGQIASERGLLWLRIKVYALHALTYQALGDPAQARTSLEQALTLAGGAMGAEGYIRIFVDEGEAMRWLMMDFRSWLAQQAPTVPQRHLLPYLDTLISAFGPFFAESASPSSPPIPMPKPALSVAHGATPPHLLEPLTPRELEVLQLIAAGHSNREIARTLVVSLGTVKKHLSNIFGKLATESRLQTVARARELHLL